MNQNPERLHGRDAAGAAIARTGAIAELLDVRGVYRFTAFSPAEHLRAEYIGLRDRLVALGHQPEIDAVMSGVPLVIAAEGLDTKVARRLLIDLWNIPQVKAWEDIARNTIMTAGKNHLLDTFLAGSSYTAALYMGLISATSYSAIAAGDTMSSHAGWLEAGSANTPVYSQSTRPAPSWGAASGGSKASNASIVYSISSGSNVVAKGAFLATNSTKDGTTGILFSAALFSQGDRTVSNGDTINGSYSLAV